MPPQDDRLSFMPKIRGVLIAFSAIVFLFLLSYIALPWLVQTALTSSLSKYDIEVTNIQFDRPSWKQLSSRSFQLKSLSLRFEEQVDVDIANTFINFNTPSAYLVLVNIDSIDIRINKPSSNNTVTDINLFDVLPSALIDDLPQVRLLVNSLTVHQPHLELKAFRIDLSNGLLTVQTILGDGFFNKGSKVFKQLIDTNILLKINTQNELELNISDTAANPLLALSLKLTKQGDLLKGDVQLNSELNAFEWPTINGSAISVNSNQLVSSNQFTLPATQRFSIDEITQLTGVTKIQNTSHFSNQHTAATTKVTTDTTLRFSLDKGKFRLTLVDPKQPIVEINGYLKRFLMPDNNYKMMDEMGTLLANLKEPLTIEYDLLADLNNPFSIIDGSFTLEYIEKNKKLIDVQFSNMEVITPENSHRSHYQFQLKGNLHLANIYRPLDIENLFISKLRGEVNSRVSIQDHHLMIQPLSKNRFEIHSLRFNEYKAKTLFVNIPNQTLSINLNTQDVSAMKFALGGQNLDSNQLNIKKWGLTANASLQQHKMSIRSSIDAMNLALLDQTYYIPPMIIKNQLWFKDLSATKSSLKLANICNDPILFANWQPKNSTEHLIDIHWQQTFSTHKTFRKWLNTPILPFDMTGGSFAGDAVIELNKGETEFKQFKVSLHDAQGVYQTGTFKGVQLQLSSPSQQLGSYKTQQAVTFDSFYAELNGHINELNMGIKANNIELNGLLYNQLNEWHFKTPLSKATVFSGLVEIQNEDINFNDAIQLELIVDRLDLSELVRTQNMDGLYTSGKLSGRIPVHYINGQFNVSDGRMNSIDGGKIRYTTPLSQSTNINDQLKLTFDVLEDFNYTTLNSKIIYDDDTLLFKSAISGRNPTVANGRLINLNLNTEVGLKGALETMRIQSGIDLNIEAFIRSKIKHSNNQYYCQ